MAPPQSWAIECHVAEIKPLDKRSQIVDVVVESQKTVWLVAQTAAQVVRSDAAILRSQRNDQLPPMKRPGWVAVNEEQRPSRSVDSPAARRRSAFGAANRD